LRDGTDLGPALRRYRRAHRFIGRYDDIGRRDALAKPPNTLQRTIRSAAVTDPWIARRLAAFGARAEAPPVLLNPAVVARALLSYLRQNR
jgi:hypothetical protein